jgi:hypothetical protein
MPGRAASPVRYLAIPQWGPAPPPSPLRPSALRPPPLTPPPLTPHPSPTACVWLQPARSQLLAAVRANCGDEGLAAVRERLDQVRR